MIGLGLQMGILDLGSVLPNSTECDSWQQAEASHTKTVLVELRVQDIYGPAVLIIIGLLLSMVTFCVEVIGKHYFRSK